VSFYVVNTLSQGHMELINAWVNALATINMKHTDLQFESLI